MRPLDPVVRRQLAPARRELAGVLAAGVLAAVLLIGQAWVVTGLVVGTVRGHPIGPWAVGVVLVLTLRAVVTWASDTLAARAASLVGTDLRRRVVTAAIGQSARQGSGQDGPTSTGEVAVLATRGVGAAEPYLTRYLPALALACVLPVLTVVAIATQDLLSAVIVVCTLPLVPLFGALVGLSTRDRAAEQWRAMASLSGHFLDVVRGLPTLVVYRRARAQSATIAAFTDRYRRASLRTLRLAFASSAVLELVATISVALVAVVVGVRLADGGLDLHTALVVLLLAPEAYWPLRRVGTEFHAAAEGVATFEAVHRLAGEAAEDETRAAVPGGPGGLVVHGLSVQYAERSHPALPPVSLTVPSRGVTVLTGVSGCGKSTLLAALAGLAPHTTGSVTLAGNSRELDVGSTGWQSQVAWLPQRPVFVSGSVADNLRLAAPDADDAALWAALRRVAMEERVRDLPHGISTDLAEDGSNLSAGERARLALARVVLADRPWAFLDEPTAHLDDLTERVILDTVAELGRTGAVLVVAHRPAVLELADHVVRLPAPEPPGAEPVPALAVGRATPAQRADVAGAVVSESYRVRLAGGTGLSALASASGVALTATAGWLIVQAASQPPVLTLLVAIVGVRTFGLARPALRYAERLVSHDAALRMLARRRVEVYDALVPLVPGRLGRRRGDVLTSVVDDVDSVVDRELRVRMPVRSIAVVVALATLVAAIVLPAAAWVLGAGALLSCSLASVLARSGAALAEHRGVTLRAELSAEVVEALQTAADLTMWQATSRTVAAVGTTGAQLGAATVRATRWLSGGRAVALAGSGLTIALTAYVVAPAVLDGTVSGPMAALLVLLPLALSELAVQVADAGAAAARTAAASQRLRLLEAQQPNVVDTPRRSAPTTTDLALRDLTAGWDTTGSTLRDLSLSLSAGERLAVVGPSGSGKSTLAALLLRFLDPARGVVELGGTPLPWLALDDVRRVVGLVDDDPHVFGSTLVENVRLARPEAGDDEVEMVLRRAGLGPWLDLLPDGLHTWLGDGHAAVSGGERARLAVARSLLARHQVVVLDEPTAHLDTVTAAAVASEILTGEPRRSVVWLTHTPAGIDLVDRVVDLTDHGQGRAGAVSREPESDPGCEPIG